MGGCVGKAANSQNQIERDRRRLSVSKAEEHPNPKDGGPRGKVTTGGSTEGNGNILDLFPQAQRKASLCGVACEAQQKEFSDKKVERGGEDGLPALNPLLKVGCACKKGLKPESPNQDDFCVFRFDATGIYGVFDGHGPYGHDISNFVQETLPRCFVQALFEPLSPEKALEKAFPECHKLCTEVQAERHFDCTLSGTTATIAMHRDGFLYLGHVGDSRAVLARHRNNELVSEDLTLDHKPTCDVERKRVQAAGGQVKRLEGDIPHRVFLAGKMYPGLAMTRSIGDTVGLAAGVISTPTVTTKKVQKDWRFMLICSDGIWEFIDSKEAVAMVDRFPPSDAQKAAETLASEAWKRWIQAEDNVVDDITVIIVWFNDD